MAIPLESRLHFRRFAPFHVQLELTKTGKPPQPAPESRIEGRVVEVFRTDGRLLLGQLVSFSLWVCEPGEEPTGPAFIHTKALERATHMEVFLEGAPPECALAGYEFAALDAPEQTPTLTIEQLERLIGR